MARVLTSDVGSVSVPNARSIFAYLFVEMIFMLRILRAVNRWLVCRQQADTLSERDPTTAASRRRPHLPRFWKHLIIKQAEECVLRSNAELAASARGALAENLRVKKAPTLITAVRGSGVQGASATMVAALTSSSAPLSGATIRFEVRGRAVGSAVTNAEGIAVLDTANLKRLKAGTYRAAITAIYAGDANHKRSIGRGGLILSRFAATIGAVSASGVHGGAGTLTATLTSRGSAVASQMITFLLNGRTVGGAVTNGQGIATLPAVSLAGFNAGVYPDAVTARLGGDVSYHQAAASGNLTVHPAQAATASFTR
jgi:hypothetical protein